MNEEDIKRKTLERLQGQNHEQTEEMAKKLSSQILDPKARERLYMLKTAKPDVAMQLELYLIQLYQSGQLRGRITEPQMISILQRMNAKRDIHIARK